MIRVGGFAAPVLFVLLSFFALMAMAQTARAFELGAKTLTDAGFTVHISANTPLVFNKMNSLIVKIEPQQQVLPLAVTAIRFDARMPAHNHGMVVKSKVTQISATEFRIDGVKLHMAGEWELIFGVIKGKQELAFKLPMAVRP